VLVPTPSYLGQGEAMLYPLKWKPYLKFYPYGGRRFVNLLHKDGVPTDRDVAETWEVADHGEEQSTVLNGPLAGKTLHELMQEFKAELVGEEVYARYGDYFPLLVKFLDCDKQLPAHMHPNDEQAAQLGLRDKGKAEAWYIVRAEAGGTAYCGARADLTPQTFGAAIERNDSYDGVMKKTATTSGETYFVPAGRLHGLGGGNLAFEIQQNSDAGFGWNWTTFVEAGVISREDAARHPALAIDCALYENGPQEQTKYVSIQETSGSVSSGAEADANSAEADANSAEADANSAEADANSAEADANSAERTFCAVCQYFVLERWRIKTPFSFHDANARFNTVTLTGGAASFAGGGEIVSAKSGESLLLPPQMEITITPQDAVAVEVLRCYVPDLARDIIEPLRARDISDRAIAWLGSYGRGNDLLPLLGLPHDALNSDP